MSQENRISISVDAATVTTVLENLNNVSKALEPYLMGLTTDERSTLAKMSDKTSAFVDKASSFCKTNSEFCPKILDLEEMDKDIQAVKALKPVLDSLRTLLSNVDDTIMLCGSEAYSGARYYYNSVSYAAKNGNLSAKPIAEDLAKRYPGVRRKKPEDHGGIK